MEVGTEISQKIRSAIKAKLLELGAYVDDELPDYIMVMVANKRSRSQMNSDLGLFLASNTVVFTEWLHSLLEKLQTVRADSERSASKQRKVEKSKSKRKDKSHHGDAAEKSNKDAGEEKTTGHGDDASSSHKKTESLEEAKSGSVSNEGHSEQKNGTEDNKSSDEGRDGHKIAEAVEDVRQLLVTEAHEVEFAEELETAEAEVQNSRTLKDVAAKPVLLTQKEISTATTSQSPSPKTPGVQTSTVSRKRKAPTSVVANVSRKEGDDEEYDPHIPAVGSVASVVKVTARKSSIPPAMQANRLLLLKAMTEAERSVTERKVAVTKPMNHASSDEVYSPKRKRSDEFIRQVSPPPYIPSKKDSIGHRSGDDSSLRRGELPRLTRNDARHILSRGGDHKVIQRSRHDEIEQSVSSDQGTSLRSKRSGSSERGRGTKENDVREMKSDKGSQVYLGSSASRQTDSRKRKYSLSPDPKHISRTSLNQDSKSSIKARLGKIIIERKDSLENHKESMEGGRDTLVTTTQRDARESIIAKTRHSESKGYARKTNSGRVISNLGREAVQKQCQAAVISVQASQTSGKIKRDLSPDSRVVQCSIQSSDEETKDEENNKRIDDAATKPPYDVQSVIVRERSPRSDYDDENEDLAKMIDEDLGPELLQDAHDDFSLDLDIDDDLDLAVEVDQNQTSATDILQPEKDEKRANTRFIVTLDGVDEKQFFTEENKYEQFMQYPPRSEPTLAAPITASNSKHPQQSLFLDLHGGQSRPVLQIKAQQVQSVMSPSVVPSKLTPPKIQPFSISLKDSDDEHDDKEGKTSTARQNYYPSVEGIAVEDSETSALKRAKMLERCKFWPACAAGASCEYHHPTTHCKTFPNCKFGDKCFFIHPNCRFDSRCIRPDCPYTHTSRRPALTSSAQVITIPQSHLVFSAMPPRPQLVGHVSMQTVCRYFPNCQNMKCPYVHPKPCRFGIACRSPACLFSHPPVPGKDKLKWQAGSEQLKPAASSLLQSTVKLEPATAKPPSPDKTSLSPAVSSTSQ